MHGDVFCGRLGVGEAPLGRLGVAIAALHDGRFLAGRSLEQQSGACYEQEMKFSTLAHLIADALLEHSGSGNQALEQTAGAGEVFAGFDHLGLRQA